MLNVLYLINHAGKAGTEKYVYNLIKCYHGKRANCFFAYNEAGALCEQVKEFGIPMFQVNMRSPFDLKAARQLAKICRENKIDIIHTHYPRENYIAVLSRLFYRRAQVIYTCHLTLPTGFAWKLANKLITPHDKKIISVCNNGKDLLVGNGVNPNKITVIFNGMPPAPAPEKSDKVRRELGISPETFVITTLSRYHLAKGLDYFVDSVAELEKIAKRDYVVLFVGDGELYDQISEQIDARGLRHRILQLGYRSDADDILRGSDLFVNSAKCYEALSFAILEALYHKLPAVATAIGGNGDIINDATACGKLVEYGDTKGMAAAINAFMEDETLYRTCSENAYKAVREVFDLDKLLDDVYREYVK